MRLKNIARAKKTLLAMLAVSVGGCAFNLGYVHPQAGKTQDQLELDMLVCKDEAARSIQDAGRMTRDIAVGASGVALPLVIHWDRKREREVFSRCMTAKGYAVSRNY